MNIFPSYINETNLHLCTYTYNGSPRIIVKHKTDTTFKSFNPKEPNNYLCGFDYTDFIKIVDDFLNDDDMCNLQLREHIHELW